MITQCHIEKKQRMGATACHLPRRHRTMLAAALTAITLGVANQPSAAEESTDVVAPAALAVESPIGCTTNGPASSITILFDDNAIDLKHGDEICILLQIINTCTGCCDVDFLDTVLHMPDGPPPGESKITITGNGIVDNTGALVRAGESFFCPSADTRCVTPSNCSLPQGQKGYKYIINHSDEHGPLSSGCPPVPPAGTGQVSAYLESTDGVVRIAPLPGFANVCQTTPIPVGHACCEPCTGTCTNVSLSRDCPTPGVFNPNQSCHQVVCLPRDCSGFVQKCHRARCNLTTGTCETDPVPVQGCCVGDNECPADTKCVDSFCNHLTADPFDNVCATRQIVGCCDADNDCPADTKCVDSFCNHATASPLDNFCDTRLVVGCCDADNDCPADTKCVDSFCNHRTSDPLDNVCATRLVEGCCDADNDCPVDTKCVDRFCNHASPTNPLDNFCDSRLILGCCDADNDCPADTKCVDSFCNHASPTDPLDNVCATRAIVGCCDADNDCPTDTACVDHFCNHRTSDPLDNVCDSRPITCLQIPCRRNTGCDPILGCQRVNDCTTNPTLCCPQDTNVCTSESCNAATGLCISTPQCTVNAECNDQNTCTQDVCQAGCCRNIPQCVTSVDCNDRDACTEDYCKGDCCYSEPIYCAPLPCKRNTGCLLGVCQYADDCREVPTTTPIANVDYPDICCRDDGNICTVEFCKKDGTCGSTGNPDCCPPDDPLCCESDLECDDDWGCTNDRCILDRASPDYHTCVFTRNDEKCDDGFSCTWPDLCLPNCTTPDRCLPPQPGVDPISGCKITPDDSKCWAFDQCLVGVCDPKNWQDDPRSSTPKEPDGCTVVPGTPGNSCESDGDPCSIERCNDYGICQTFTLTPPGWPISECPPEAAYYLAVVAEPTSLSESDEVDDKALPPCAAADLDRGQKFYVEVYVTEFANKLGGIGVACANVDLNYSSERYGLAINQNDEIDFGNAFRKVPTGYSDWLGNIKSLGACTDVPRAHPFTPKVGVFPKWALLARIEFQPKEACGELSFQLSESGFGTTVHNVHGSPLADPVDYGAKCRDACRAHMYDLDNDCDIDGHGDWSMFAGCWLKCPGDLANPNVAGDRGYDDGLNGRSCDGANFVGFCDPGVANCCSPNNCVGPEDYPFFKAALREARYTGRDCDNPHLKLPLPCLRGETAAEIPSDAELRDAGLEPPPPDWKGYNRGALGEIGVTKGKRPSARNIR